MVVRPQAQTGERTSRECKIALTYSCILEVSWNVRGNLGKQSSPMPKISTVTMLKPKHGVIILEEVLKVTVLKKNLSKEQVSSSFMHFYAEDSFSFFR